MAPLIQAILGVLGLSLVWALFALPVMKFYARSQSLARLLAIAYWAFLRVTLALLAIYIVWIIGLGKTAASLSPFVSIVVICSAGALISRSLKKAGVTMPFPGIGARAMVGLLAISWLLVGVAWMAGAFKA